MTDYVFDQKIVALLIQKGTLLILLLSYVLSCD